MRISTKGGSIMNSIYASEQIKQVIWPEFIAHFKSKSSKASYQADIIEFLAYTKKDFLDIRSGDIKKYYEFINKKVSTGMIQSSTMAKKIRELHSFAKFIVENRERYHFPNTFRDYFFSYLEDIGEQEKYAKSVPVEHIDKLLKAAESDLMAYTILVLMHRAGLSSTEIINLRQDDFAAYDNGVYVSTIKKDICFIPEDAHLVLEQYIAVCTCHDFLFYNRRGDKLNTMYISRLMKKYTAKADLPPYSAETIRNTCGFTMFAYGANTNQVAAQMGITNIQIKRYKSLSYRENLMSAANHLVKIRVDLPGIN